MLKPTKMSLHFHNFLWIPNCMYVVYFMDQISCCLFGSKLQKQWTFDFLERKCLFWFSCWIPNTNYCSQRPIIIFCNSAILCQNSTKIKIRRPTFWKWHFKNIILVALKNPFSIWLYLLFIDRYTWNICIISGIDGEKKYRIIIISKYFGLWHLLDNT